MTEFKVGDKVTHSEYGNGEVKYPYLSAALRGQRVVVQFDQDSEGERVAHPAHLTPRPAFKVGDRANHDVYGDVKIVGGPFKTQTSPCTYLAEYENEWHGLFAVSALSPLPSPAPLAIGDKIRILEDGLSSASVRAGDILTVTGVQKGRAQQCFSVDPAESWWFPYSAEGTGWERVTDDTEPINGVTYVMGAKYQDRQGYFWEFSREGSKVKGEWSSPGGTDEGYGWYLAEAVKAFGPLTRVED